jgi:NADH-quinone oxidoreductase subunit N
MYFDEPVYEQSVNGTSFAKGILGINGLMILALGIFPAGLMSLCLNAMRSTLIGS